MSAESVVICSAEVLSDLHYTLAPSTCGEHNLSERNLAVSDFSTSQ